MNWKTETIYSSPIPVSAEQLPQQRVTEVIEMPDRRRRIASSLSLAKCVRSSHDRVYPEFIDYYPDYPVSTPRKNTFPRRC